MTRLCTWFRREDNESLRRAFRDFIFEYTDENNAAALVHLLDHPEDLMTTKQRWQQYTRNLLDQGRLEGRQEGRLEGRQEGRLEGRQEGRLEGQKRTLVKLLRLKFPGVAVAKLEERMAEGKATDLDRWTERVLTARSLNEVFAPLE